jgi:hypothetical protein
MEQAVTSLSLLFTGHMVDLPTRQVPRFPPEIVDAVQGEIAKRISYHVGTRDKKDVKGFASLARGGDILFHEACRQFGIDTTVVLPFAPVEFLRTSVEGAEGGNWPQRFVRIWEATPPGERYLLNLPISDAAYAECNDRMLDLARVHGPVQLIAVWDGSGGDGPGGTSHFLACAKQVSGREPDVVDPKSFLSKYTRSP